jgi:hypothetical protein
VVGPVWAIEGCRGIGRHIALRLIDEGEQVVDMPPMLSARTRVFATGQGHKTDATDAHSVALVGTRIAGLRPVGKDEQLEGVRLLVDRRRSIGEEHARKVSQLHALVLEAHPGAAPKRYLSAAQGKKVAGQCAATRHRREDRNRVALDRRCLGTGMADALDDRHRRLSARCSRRISPVARSCWPCQRTSSGRPLARLRY